MSQFTPHGEARACFNAHVNDDTDECVLWPYTRNPRGYGYLDKRGVHVLACELAHGPCPPGLQVRHSCRNKHCFNKRHVSWGTPQQNMDDQLRDGTRHRGERSGTSRLIEVQVLDIRQRLAEGVSQPQLAREFGISQSAVSLIGARKTWRHI